MASRIAYVQYTNPGAYPPLEHSSRFLAEAGWSVLFLGTDSFGANALTFPEHAGIVIKRLPFCPPGIRQKVHYVAFCCWVFAWVVIWRPQWVYASDPLACPVVLALTWLRGLRAIYHEHDSPASSDSWFQRTVLWSRRKLAGRAACAVLPNEHRMKRFSEAQPDTPVHCVWNCPRKDETSEPREQIDSEKISLVYHGSIGPSRLPLSILNALARLPEALTLRVTGYETAGSRGYVDAIRVRAKDLGIAHRLEIGPPVPRFQLLQYCRSSDIGIALVPMKSGDINMMAMSGASNKAFDYLACGVPLLVSDLPEWRRMFVEPGYGVACTPEDAESVERALWSLLKSPSRIRAMGERGRQRICREWNYESQFMPILSRLNAIRPAAEGFLRPQPPATNG